MNNLEFAINMEHDGEKFYKKQAEKNKDNSLNTVFLLLEEDEAHHARILQNKFNELTDSNTLSQVNNVFKESKGFISEFEKIPNQLDAYKFALEIERKSIDLYKSFLSESTDDQSKELFEFLIKQEKDHYTIFEELILLVERPEEWVENAEFGIREEY
ncbi:ferritin family protein [Acetobacterium sp.]|uniref:ferritin family protein n=1 Tax=Acetobacterium sp. TaxID=1872094 RepID=UPI002F42896B